MDIGAVEVQPDPLPVVVAPTSLPDAEVGAAYSQTITASGPPGPFTFTVTAGTLPAGLTLGADGRLTGTPTAADTASFTVTATGPALASGSQVYTLTVNADPGPVEVSPSRLPDSRVGAVYGRTITASGPPGPFTFAVTAGTLPPGLTLNEFRRVCRDADDARHLRLHRDRDERRERVRQPGLQRDHRSVGFLFRRLRPPRCPRRAIPPGGRGTCRSAVRPSGSSACTPRANPGRTPTRRSP